MVGQPAAVDGDDRRLVVLGQGAGRADHAFEGRDGFGVDVNGIIVDDAGDHLLSFVGVGRARVDRRGAQQR